MSCAVLRSTPSHLFTSILSALLSPTMLDAESRRRLRRFVATIHGTASASSMRRTEKRPTNSRLFTTILLTPFSATMSRTKELVAGPLVAARKGAASTTTVGNAKPSRALGALGTAGVLAHTIAAVSTTIRTTRYSRFFASLNPTWLESSETEDHRVRRQSMFTNERTMSQNEIHTFAPPLPTVEVKPPTSIT